MLFRPHGRVFILILLIVLLANCRSTSGPTGPELSLNFGFDPATIDPALATDPPTIQLDNLLFLNLTGVREEDGAPEPALAQDWRVSQDRLTWEFHLRSDVYWVSYNTATSKAEKKRPVNAGDVVYSVRRLFDPRTQSPYAVRLAPLIRNAGTLNHADPRTSPADLQKMADAIGVVAKDEQTVQFVLNRPMSAFPALVATWLGRVQPREAIEEGGLAWTEPGTVWTSGPYVFESWDHNQSIMLRRNPFYPDAANVQIETLRFRMIPDASSALDAYLRGELDTTDPYDSIEGDQLARVEEDQTLTRDKKVLPGLCSQYIGFNTSQPPFNDVRVRKAFAVGLNRDELMSSVFTSGQAARWFTPPGIIAAPDISSTIGLSFNAPQARDLVAQSGWGAPGKELPQIEFYINANDTFHSMAVAASYNWKATVGALVHVNMEEWTAYLDKLQKDPPPLFRMGFCATYPDAANFMYDVFHSGSDMNFSRWSSADYDRLVEQAAVETDVLKRRELYQAAEKLLVEDQAVIIPILWSTRVAITNPHVQRTFSVLEGYEHIERWKVSR